MKIHQILHHRPQVTLRLEEEEVEAEARHHPLHHHRLGMFQRQVTQRELGILGVRTKALSRISSSLLTLLLHSFQLGDDPCEQR